MKKIYKLNVSIFIYTFVSFLILAFFSFFKIDSAVSAGGSLLPFEEKKTIEHLDGGIVSKIYVKNGDYVKKNDSLIKLDSNQILATIENTEQQLKIINEQDKSLKRLEQQGIYDYPRRNEVLKEKSRLDADLKKLHDLKNRTIIVSNYNGFINDIQVKGEGEIISPKMKIMEIIPETEELLLNLEINPKDVMFVKIGMKIKVLINTANPKYNEFVYTKLDYISADIMLKQNGHTYYRATAKIKKSDIHAFDLKPGMQVIGYIILGERSIMKYFFDPVYKTLINAFYEV